MNEKLLNFLLTFVSEHKKELFKRVAANRTRYLTMVLEDIYQPHNASAILRSADCFGIQDVHLIEKLHTFSPNRDVALGASQWLTLHRHNTPFDNTRIALNSLKSTGYRIIAATPHSDDQHLEAFDLSKGKTAVIFGSERPGLSETAKEMADGYMKIPLAGFTDSLNISVSVATIFHHLSWKLRNSELPWQLTREEYIEVQLAWAKQAIKHSDLIIKDFYAKNS